MVQPCAGPGLAVNAPISENDKTVTPLKRFACLSERLRSARRWLPGRGALLPLVIRQLLDARTVVTHHEDLAVWLGSIRIHRFIFEPHPRAGKNDVLAIR